MTATLKQYTPAPLVPVSELAALRQDDVSVPDWAARHLPVRICPMGGTATIRLRVTGGHVLLRDRLNRSRFLDLLAGEDNLITLSTPFEIRTQGGPATFTIDVEAVARRELAEIGR